MTTRILPKKPRSGLISITPYKKNAGTITYVHLEETRFRFLGYSQIIIIFYYTLISPPVLTNQKRGHPLAVEMPSCFVFNPDCCLF